MSGRYTTPPYFRIPDTGQTAPTEKALGDAALDNTAAFLHTLEPMPAQIAALGTAQANLNTLVTSWVGNQTLRAATYVTTSQFKVTGDLTLQFSPDCLILLNLGADGVKFNTVASSSFGAGVTTVDVDVANLTGNLAHAIVLFSASTNAYVLAADYGSPGQTAFDLAIGAIGVLPRMLLLSPGDWGRPTSDIPANVTLCPQPGALIDPGDDDLIINNLEAGPYQIFSCTGSGDVLIVNNPLNFGVWYGLPAQSGIVSGICNLASWDTDPGFKLNRNLVPGSSPTDGHGHGFEDATVFNRGDGTTAYSSFYAWASLAGSRNYDHMRSFQAYPTVADGYVGTVTEITSYISWPKIYDGTVTTLAHFKLADAGGSFDGTIVNNYGLYMSGDLTRGTNNYLIYAADCRAEAYIGGPLKFAGVTSGGGTFPTGRIISDFDSSTGWANSRVVIQNATDVDTWINVLECKADRVTLRHILNLITMTAAPASPQLGDIYHADRATWDPCAKGSGTGYYCWHNGVTYKMLHEQ